MTAKWSRRAAKRGQRHLVHSYALRRRLRGTGWLPTATWWVGKRTRTDLLATMGTHGPQQPRVHEYLYGCPLSVRRKLSRDALVLVSGPAPWVT